MLSVLVPFDIGVVYIDENGMEGKTVSFSPLRYWGGLYPTDVQHELSDIVLVPFDIGVVYIIIISPLKVSNSFSPLRYWGGLYQYTHTMRAYLFSFSPLRYWGGLYQL